MGKRLYTHFDLPVGLHESDRLHEELLKKKHFMPPKSRDEEEIARRKALAKIAPGILTAEFQYRGLAMAHIIMNRLESKPALDFTGQTLAPAALNTAWYSFARGAEVMRRRLLLPKLATENVEDRPSALMLQYDSSYYFKQSAEEGLPLIAALKDRSPAAKNYHRRVAQNVGHAGLLATCISLGDQIGYEMGGVPDFELQAIARQRSLRALERAQTMHAILGVPPSIAQLADPDSPLSVYWRREAPNQEAVDIYSEAYDTMATVKTEVPTT